MDVLKVLHIDQFEEKGGSFDFYCNDFKSHLNDHLHSISRAHKHGFFVTVIFTAGSGTHEIDFSSYPIKPGSVFMMVPGQVHNWTFTNDIDGFIFFHSQEFFDRHFTKRSVYQFPFFFSTQNKPGFELSPNHLEKLKGLCDELQEEYHHKQPFGSQKRLALVDLIYLNLSRWYLEEVQQELRSIGGYSAKLRELGRLVDENFEEVKSPTKYAAMMNISPKHLNRIVKSSVGKTTSDLILDRITLEAKRRLVHEQSSLAQIAYSLGYEDYAYFSKLFKARTGYPPKAFREKYG